ncbi:unnamed protein product, partial [marine sediment metagenome]
FFILLVIGFLLSLAAPSAVLSYLMIFACGMMGGRIWYEQRDNFKFPFFLIIIGFLIGYLIGTRYANLVVLIAFFVIGGILSYYLHKKKIIHSIRY